MKTPNLYAAESCVPLLSLLTHDFICPCPGVTCAVPLPEIWRKSIVKESTSLFK